MCILLALITQIYHDARSTECQVCGLMVYLLLIYIPTQRDELASVFLNLCETAAR